MDARKIRQKKYRFPRRLSIKTNQQIMIADKQRGAYCYQT